MVVGEEGSIGLALQPPTHHATSMTIDETFKRKSPSLSTRASNSGR